MTDAGAMFNDGKTYERMMGRWSKRVGVQFLDWLNPAKNLKWIEVGCGNGAFTEELIAHCAPLEISAIDPSEGQLAFARTRPGAKLAQFKQADAQALPFADRSFDAAVMALVISFIPDPAKAVAEMARVVRPGGAVATYMWDFAGGGTPNTPVGRVLKAMGKDYARVSDTASNREVMQSLWQGAGLQEVETRVIRISVNFTSFDDFCESSLVPIGPAGQVLKAMSASELNELKARLRELLPAAADGSITYEAFANAVKGRVAG